MSPLPRLRWPFAVPGFGLEFCILDVNVAIHGPPARTRRGLDEVFAAFPRERHGGVGLRYTFMSSSSAARRENNDIVIVRDGLDTPLHAEDEDDAVFVIEKDVTVQLQYLRSELCFLHAAVIARDGRAYVLAAESGKGKSTTCWALLHRGFDFLSDELAPVALDTLLVHPCPFALVLKRAPPQSHPLPRAIVPHGRIRVPAPALPSRPIEVPLPLAGLFFVDYDGSRSAPAIRTASAGEAAARLYVSTLNALAHGHHGVDAVTQIVNQVPCYALAAAELTATCRLIEETVSQGRH